MNIATHNYPHVESAFNNNQNIQFKTDSSDWFDYDADSVEPPSFSSPILQWRVKPAKLHPMFEGIIAQFQSINEASK